MNGPLLVFDIHGLSIRNGGCFGNVEADTPVLDALATMGRVFDRYYCSPTDKPRLADGASTLRITDEEQIENFGGDISATLSQSDAEVLVQTDFSVVEDVLALAAPFVENATVVVTSSCPLPSDCSLGNEAVVRVPLIVCRASVLPARVQSLVTGRDFRGLVGRIERPAAPSPDHVCLTGDDEYAVRSEEYYLTAGRDLVLEATQAIRRDAWHPDVGDPRLALYRKPDDVWNVHNIVAEAPAIAREHLEHLVRFVETET